MAGGMPLQNSVAVVTGASRGIGRAIAVGLAAQGARVAIVARTLRRGPQSLGGLAETAELAERVGGTAIPFVVDLLRASDVEAFVRDVRARMGPVDILANVAANIEAPMYQDFDALTVEEFRAQIELNLVAPYALMKAFCGDMRRGGGGRVINLTSGAASLREPGSAPLPGRGGSGVAYGASKAALNRMTNALANELRAFNIAVIALNPGSTTTEMRPMLAERFGFSAEGAYGTDVPARAVLHLATCQDPMRYTGSVLTCSELLASLEA
jgi:NAD(P)-dependent dehydrogenase (short-subunit alcohol dehydrogenase family)